MSNILKKIKILIQNSKKLYFTHFFVIAFFPATLLWLVALCCVPHDLYFLYKYGALGDDGCFVFFITLTFFYYLYSLLFLIIVCIIMTIIMWIVKHLLKKRIYVTSKFLLYNKFYNLLYIISYVFFIFDFVILFFIFLLEFIISS